MSKYLERETERQKDKVTEREIERDIEKDTQRERERGHFVRTFRRRSVALFRIVLHYKIL